MTQERIVVSVARDVLAQLDGLIANSVFASRSQAIEIALQEKLTRLKRRRLTKECSKLDPAFERAMAEGEPGLL